MKKGLTDALFWLDTLRVMLVNELGYCEKGVHSETKFYFPFGIYSVVRYMYDYGILRGHHSTQWQHWLVRWRQAIEPSLGERRLWER